MPALTSNDLGAQLRDALERIVTLEYKVARLERSKRR
ncbi:unnamed protein product, partial [Rotaria magnacalcarata]